MSALQGMTRIYVPSFYPDEIAYSLVARWARHLLRPSLPQFHRWLLGFDTLGSIAMPRHLVRLAARMGSTMSTKRLIDQHTLWSIWKPFVSPATGSRILHAMKTDSGAPPAAYVAAQSGPAMPSAPTLRFCPDCADYDTARYGEPYWHRLHQAPGVGICPTHGEILRKVDGTQETDGTLADQRERPSVPVYPGILTKADRTVLISVATDVAWYLVGSPAPAQLPVRYQRSLDHHGWLRPSGHMRTRFVREALQSMLSEAMWTWFASTWAPDAPYTWIEAILRHTGSVHPLRHILLQQCLASDAETFWRRPAPKRQQVETSPWPCKNRVSVHYGTLRVTDVKFNRAANSGHLLGTGTCSDCGFTYRQRVANGQPTDERSFRIIDPGAIWTQAFTTDWRDPAVPLGVIARRFHLTYALTHRMAHRLSLPPRSKTADLPGLADRWADPATSLATIAQQYGIAVGTLVHRAEAKGLPPRPVGGRRQQWDRDADRERWRKLRHQHPQATRSDLRRLDPATFARLSRHDRQWLDRCIPAQSRKQTLTRPVDWDTRDRAACARISDIVNRWYHRPGRPRRCTAFGICSALDVPFPVWTNLHRLPRTAAALRNAQETDVSFAIRRLEWAAEHLRAAGQPVTATNLRAHVVLKPETRRHPAVLTAWDKLLADF